MNIFQLIKQNISALNKKKTITSSRVSSIGYVYQLDCNYRGRSACGVSTVSMITGLNVNNVDLQIRVDKKLNRQNQNILINYMQGKGILCQQITNWQKKLKPSYRHFDSFRRWIDDGYMIFYHIPGHYLLMTGYCNEGFIFNDPAGSRLKRYFNKHGENVIYTEKNLTKWKIKCAVVAVKR